MKAKIVDVTTSATLIAGGGVATVPKTVIVSNTGAASIYLGADNVTTAVGFPLAAGDSVTIPLVGEELYAIAAGLNSVNVLEVN